MTLRTADRCTVSLPGLRLMFGLSDGAVATVIPFGTSGRSAMLSMTTGVGLYTRLTGRWNPALGELKLGAWGLVINTVAFAWSVFELVNIAWPRPYATAPNAPWWQLWAVPLVLGTIVSVTALYILMSKIRRKIASKGMA